MSVDFESYLLCILFLLGFGFGPGLLSATVACTTLAKPSWSTYLKGYGIGGIVGAVLAAIGYPFILGAGKGFLAIVAWPLIVVSAIAYGIVHFFILKIAQKLSTESNPKVLWLVPLSASILVMSLASIDAADRLFRGLR